MKILQIKNIEKKDIPLHYRNEYKGLAVMEMAADTRLEKQINFILERSPMGQLDVSVELLEDLDYPLLPVIRTLKEFITELDKRGELP